MRNFRIKSGSRFSILFVLVICICCLKAAAQEEENPAKWTLNVEKKPGKIAKDDSFAATLSVKIEKGWHLYALEKIDGGPIPTSISLAENQPFELGTIDFPPPIETDDAVFGVVTKFYEDSAKFRLPLRAVQIPESAKIQVKVRYQICSSEMCLPPKSVLVEADL